MNVKQVSFKEITDGEHWKGGILIDDRYLICGCCGCVYDLENEDYKNDIIAIKYFTYWVDISDEIIGE